MCGLERVCNLPDRDRFATVRGPQCGTTYQYCYASNPPYHEGCTTSYYDVWYPSRCYCP